MIYGMIVLPSLENFDFLKLFDVDLGSVFRKYILPEGLAKELPKL